MTSTHRLLMATALAGAMLPQAALASAADFLARHEVTLAELDAGRALDERGLGFLSTNRMANGAILFEGAALQASDGRILVADELMVSDTVVMLRNGVLSRDAENEAFSKVTLDSVLIEGPDAARIIMMGPDDVCAPVPAANLGASRIEAQGIRLSAPSLGHQAGMKADEELSISSLEMGFTWTEDDCGSFDYLRMRSLSSETPEGDSMTIAAFKASLEPGAAGQVRFDLSLSDAAFTSAAADTVARAKDVRFVAAMPMAWLAEDAAEGGVEWGDPTAALMALAGSNAELGIEVAGLELPMGELMPGHVLDRLQLDKDSRYGGSVNVTLEASEGRLSFGHDLRLAGLANSAASIAVAADPQALAAQASMGVLGIASAVNLISATFSHEDLGLNETMKAATGRDLDTVIREAAGRIPAPSAAKAPIIDWLASALTSEGRVEARPAHPVPLVQIGMSLAMAPGSLVNILNLSVSE